MPYRRAAVASMLAMTLSSALAQPAAVTALCSTDQSWCELAAQEFTKATGIRVLQTRKPTGEALAQLRAEAANPKTDLWWGGTGEGPGEKCADGAALRAAGIAGR